MHTAKGIDENSLKLTGDKIKLTVRPLETRGTASSRCALLGKGYQRPLSAVPLLNLNYNEFAVHTNTRRPLSADFPISRLKNSSYRSSGMTHSGYVSNFVDEETSLDSSEDTDGNLPSSQLLHNLLSEPLYSWRNGVRCKPARKTKICQKSTPKPPKNTFDHDSNAGSDTSSSAESLRTKPPIKTPNEVVPRLDLVKDPQLVAADFQPAQPSNHIDVDDANPFQSNHVEVMKEPQHSKINQDVPMVTLTCNNSPNSMVLVPGLKTKPPLPKKPDSSHPNTNRTKKVGSPSQNNFEKITFDMLNYGLVHSNPEPERHSTVNHKYKTSHQTSTSTLSSDSDAIELKFQNWFQEELKANDEIVASEISTNITLQKLKVQNQNVDNIKKPPGTTSAKVVNFEAFDVETLKRDYEKHKKNGAQKDFIKQNIKLSSVRNGKKSTLAASNADEPKRKFVPTQMKAFPEYTETSENREMESWMSSNLQRSPKTIDEINEKPTSYVDCLNKIDELQETFGGTCTDDVPEHDKVDDGIEETTDQSDANTYDDIVSILQVLEAEDKKSQTKMDCIKEIINNELSTSDSEDNTKPISHRSANSIDHSKRNELSKVSFQKLEVQSKSPKSNKCQEWDCLRSNKSRDEEQPSRTSLNSSMNLNDIFSYLDEVDRNCAKSVACAKERIQYATQLIETNLALDTIPKLEELLAHTNVELAHHIVDLSLRLKDKASSIALLQKELSGLRNQVIKMTKDTNETVKQRLRTQKDDYENVVKRHQKFIDQLISDKKTLNQQCEGLIHEMKVLEDRYNSNLKAAEHRHKVELQKVKEMQVAGEKMRRERWIDTKTQKIKELTVKGLEPELDKMAARHQQELSDLRSLHKREIEDLELRAARKLQQQCESLREQLTAEREKALVHEREVLRQRYEQLVESEEKNYQEQRRRLLADHANKVSECEERENAAVVERDRAIKQAHNEFEDKLQVLVRRHNSELSLLKEKTELEMEAFRNNYKKQAAVQLTEKEMQIREKFRKERDKEIEAVIERLEMESDENKLQMEQSTENRIRRLKDKYEKEIKDLECTEKEASCKYAETKGKLLESEDVVINLKATVKQLEIQLQETKEFSEKLSSERNKIKDIVKVEMQQDIQALEKEVQELRNDKDKELQQVYARVKVAVARKDETIAELSRDHTALQEKCAYLESILEQQRKEYLIK